MPAFLKFLPIRFLQRMDGEAALIRTRPTSPELRYVTLMSFAQLFVFRFGNLSVENVKRSPVVRAWEMFYDQNMTDKCSYMADYINVYGISGHSGHLADSFYPKLPTSTFVRRKRNNTPLQLGGS